MLDFRFRERPLSRFVKLFDHATPRVVLLKDGSAFVMIQVDGLPVQTLDADVMYRVRRALNHALCGLVAHTGIQLYLWTCRGYADASLYPPHEFPSAFQRQLDDRYRAKLLTRNLYLNRTYVGLRLRPAALGGQWVDSKLPRPSRDVMDEKPVERIRRLLRICEIFTADLEAYKPRMLGLRQESDRTFSEVAEALIFAMTGVWRSVGLQAHKRVGMLFSERIIVGREAIEIRTPGRSEWCVCFGTKHMMWNCPPGALDGFLKAPFRSTVKHSFRVMAMNETMEKMGRKQNRMVSAGDRAHSQIKELDVAQDEVQSGRMILGDYSLVVAAFADTEAEIPSVANDAWHVLQNAGAQVAREDAALEAAYYTMLPGNDELRPRPGAITSWNYASLASMHAFPAGDETGKWGGPLAIFRSSGGTPVRFHPQTKTGVGNMFCFGESGSGKSVFLCFLAAQAARLDVQVVFWDKDRGAEIMTRAVGGRYLSIRNPTGIAPLKAYSASPDNIQQLARLIRGAINMPNEHEWTPEEGRRLFIGLNGIMALAPENRRMIDLRAFLGTAPNGAGAKLEKWRWGNEYGFVMDNPTDEIKLDARVIGLDVTTFLDDPMTCGPIVTDLLYRTAKLADGRRILYIVDEAWKVLNIPAFAAAAMDHLKVDRKKNAALLLGSQSIRDGLDSPIGYTIREQCKTVVAFGVERPDRADFKALRYTNRECDIIEELKPGTGQFLLRQDKRSVVCHMPLDGSDDELAVLSGNSVNVGVLDEVRAALPDDVSPEELIATFHRERKARR